VNQEELIHNWNRLPGRFDYASATVELNDETLRGMVCRTHP
jgi:hypothetical protein